VFKNLFNNTGLMGCATVYKIYSKGVGTEMKNLLIKYFARCLSVSIFLIGFSFSVYAVDGEADAKPDHAAAFQFHDERG